jgi:hypothetical protein
MTIRLNDVHWTLVEPRVTSQELDAQAEEKTDLEPSAQERIRPGPAAAGKKPGVAESQTCRASRNNRTAEEKQKSEPRRRFSGARSTAESKPGRRQLEP